MVQQLKRILLTLGASAALLFPGLIASTAVVSAQTCVDGNGTITSCLGSGACLNTNDPNCDTGGDPNDRVNRIIKIVINVFSLIVGVASVIMIIVGGLKYVTSGGDSNNITSAKNTILYAVIGLVVVAFAQIIVRFVLQKTTNTV